VRILFPITPIALRAVRHYLHATLADSAAQRSLDVASLRTHFIELRRSNIQL